MREKKTTCCFYRGTIPTLEEDKCACMHGQKLRHPGDFGGLEREALFFQKKVLTSVSLSANKYD